MVKDNEPDNSSDGCGDKCHAKRHAGGKPYSRGQQGFNRRG